MTVPTVQQTLNAMTIIIANVQRWDEQNTNYKNNECQINRNLKIGATTTVMTIFASIGTVFFRHSRYFKILTTISLSLSILSILYLWKTYSFYNKISLSLKDRTITQQCFSTALRGMIAGSTAYQGFLKEFFKDCCISKTLYEQQQQQKCRQAKRLIEQEFFKYKDEEHTYDASLLNKLFPDESKRLEAIEARKCYLQLSVDLCNAEGSLLDLLKKQKLTNPNITQAVQALYNELIRFLYVVPASKEGHFQVLFIDGESKKINDNEEEIVHLVIPSWQLKNSTDNYRTILKDLGNNHISSSNIDD